MMTNNRVMMVVLNACSIAKVELLSVAVIGVHIEFKVNGGKRHRIVFYPAQASYADIDKAVWECLQKEDAYD